MTLEGLRRTADDFWRRATEAGVPFGQGRDIERAVEAALPVSVVPMPVLTPNLARDWMLRQGTLADLEGDEPLRGCLFACRGVGFLFVRKEDDADEQRFTVAHELAHFLLHYDRPRREAGEAMVAVLDGDRPATAIERMNGALVGRPVRPHVHLFGAEDETLAENEADALAIELLAPASLRRDIHSPEAVAERFGIPVRLLESAMRPARADSLVEWARDVLRTGGRR